MTQEASGRQFHQQERAIILGANGATPSLRTAHVVKVLWHELLLICSFSGSNVPMSRPIKAFVHEISFDDNDFASSDAVDDDHAAGTDMPDDAGSTTPLLAHATK